MSKIARLILISYVLISNKVSAAIPAIFDPSVEQNWAEELTTRLKVGDAVWLADDLGKFLTLYTKAIGLSRNFGAVILFPSPNNHPDSEPIHTLRINLPKNGWHTLAVQLPTVIAGATPEEYLQILPTACARLRAAINWFAEQKIANLIVLGHAFGALIATACIAEIGDNNELTGLVLLGAGGINRLGTLPTTLDSAQSLEKINLPIFDLYGEYDIPAANNDARARVAGRRERKQGYTQVLLPGADYRFNDLEEVVAGRISGWLRRCCLKP